MSELASTLFEEFTDREYAHAYLQENSNLRIAAQIRAIRMERGWTQEELAERTGMKQARISKIESADFDSLSLTTLRRMAEAFDVNLSVKFSSVIDAIADIESLSPETLQCATREEELAAGLDEDARAKSIPLATSSTKVSPNFPVLTLMQPTQSSARYLVPTE